MLQEKDRHLLQDDLPFAPVAPPTAPPVPWLERAMDAGTRWRRPLTAVLAVGIMAAAFFAYQSQRPGGGETAVAPGRGDGVAAMVDGIAPGPVGASSTATTAAATAGGRSTLPTSTMEPAGPSTSAAVARTSTSAGQLAGAGTTRRPASSTTGAGGSSTASSAASSTTGGASSTTSGSSTSASSSPTTIPTTTPTTVATTVASTTASTASTTSSIVYRTVFVGDRVSFDDWDGPGVKGVTVTLWTDANRDGREDSVRATATTSDSGAYRFDVDPGCYVVTFGVPNGQSVLKGDQRKALCLGLGQNDNRIDLVISRPVVVRAPTSCIVYVGRFNGAVEVRDSSGTFTSSYGFYDSGGNLVVSTASLGSPSSSGRTSRTWAASRSFEESGVVSVAGEDGKGNSSTRVTCTRQNVF